VPAGVGVMLHFQRMADEVLPNVIALVASTFITIAVTALATLLWATGTAYPTYFEGAQFVHCLLGPATVALAIQHYAWFGRLRRMAMPLLAALLIGHVLGASDATLLALAPKSVTTPIAIGIAERIGGLPSLTAVLVMLTGILGAVGARSFYALLKIDDHAVRGFAIGVASHGIGKARAFQVSEQAGARRPGHGPQRPADRRAAAVADPAADARVGLNPQQVGAGEATILGVADSSRCISPRSPGAPRAAD